MSIFHASICEQDVREFLFICTPNTAEKLLAGGMVEGAETDGLFPEGAVSDLPGISGDAGVAFRKHVQDIAGGRWNAYEGERMITLSAGQRVTKGREVLQAIAVLETPTPVYVVREAVAPPPIRAGVGEGPGGHAPDEETNAGAAMQKNRNVLLSVTRKLIQWERGDVHFEGKAPTEYECNYLLGKRPEVAVSVDLAVSANRRSRGLITSSVAGFCHYQFSRIDEKAANTFFDRVADGANLPPRHPVLALRERLLTDRPAEGKTKRSGTTKDDQRVAWVIRAWNAVREDRPLTFIQQGLDDPMPVPK